MGNSGTQSSLEKTGGNRTGMITAPLLSREMTEGAAAAPSSEGGPEALALLRAGYIREGFPVGSLPPPPLSVEGAVEAAAQLVGTTTGVATLADKLSERLAFERSGTRLYDALIGKVAALGESTPGPTLVELRQIRDDEHRHFLLVRQAITTLGGDPTVMSPCADTVMVSSLGLIQVLTDPRTTVPQCLQAILTAELTDNDGWQLLIQLADGLGHEELAGQFREALAAEESHLARVRGWLSTMLMEQARA
jgi:hypothetical protein